MTGASKFSVLTNNCVDLIHPWNKSCVGFSYEVLLFSFICSLKFYFKYNAATFLIRRKLFSKKNLKQFCSGILQSSIFLSLNVTLVYSFICIFRHILGYFNIATIVFLPALVACIITIFTERKSRRILLALYMSNLASETVWKMLESREMVKSIPYATTIIFSASIGLLLMFYKGGQYKYKDENGRERCDGMFNILRYILGSHEEHNSLNNKEINKNESKYLIVKYYRNILLKLTTSFQKHELCSHSDNCISYILEGPIRILTLGASVETVMLLLSNAKKIIKNPTLLKKIFLQNEKLFSTTLVLTKFVFIFKAVNCILRCTTGTDSKYNNLLAGFLAGLSYAKYNNKTIALYLMWNALHVTYNLGIRSNILPNVPYFPELLFAISGSIMYHGNIFEPNTTRLSYIKFLHEICGGRLSMCDQKAFGQWGYNCYEQTSNQLKKLNLKREVKYLFG